MFNFNELIQCAYESAYGNAYDLPLKKQYSAPKIYSAKGDIKKRWYIYFSYRNPNTGKLEMQTPYYGEANKYRTKEERLAALTVYCRIVDGLLKQGYNPYEDNTERFQATKEKFQPPSRSSELEFAPAKGESMPKEPTKTGSVKDGKDMGKTLGEALEHDMNLKTKLLRDSSMRSYKSHLGIFRKWMKKNHPKVRYINELDKPMVLEFLNSILESSSARNYNNYRGSLSSMMGTLESNDMVPSNFVRNIRKLRTDPQRHKTYSREEQEKIFAYLEKNDELLLLYIQFVSYCFMRPIEVCRLRVGDLDLKNQTLSYKAKNSPLKTKIIPDILVDVLPDLSKLEKNAYLFTPQGLGGSWDISSDAKRGYFSKRFKKVVKKAFGFDQDHGIYSFRHTFITKLYRLMAAKTDPQDAKQKLMLITGHSSMAALEKYLRNIDAALPEDYSKMLRN